MGWFVALLLESALQAIKLFRMKVNSLKPRTRSNTKDYKVEFYSTLKFTDQNSDQFVPL